MTGFLVGTFFGVAAGLFAYYFIRCCRIVYRESVKKKNEKEKENDEVNK